MKRLLIVCGAALVVLGAGCDTRTGVSTSSQDEDEQNSNGNEGVNVVSPANDATLRSISVEPGELSPTFSATTARYSVILPQGSSSIAISARPTNADATLTIDETSRSAGETVNVSVAPPSTPIVLNVSSADGTENRAYRVTVRFESSGNQNNNDNSAPMLSVPDNFRVLGVTSDSVNLAWDALADATNYTVYRDTSATGTFSTVVGATTNTVLTDLNLDPLTTYFYRLQATNSSASGTLSDALPATTLDVAGIQFSAVRCTGGPIYTDSNTAVTLEVDVDVRNPDNSRTPVDSVTVDVRPFGTAFESMTRQGGSATWTLDTTIP
ncbi:MAG: cadherin-like beta sandwich domain-containing protein, partial [Myxococcota bacterium]